MSFGRPDYALLARYLGGECTDAEVARVRTWLAEEQGNAVAFEAFEKLWRTAATHPTRVDVDMAWSRVEQGMNGPSERETVRGPVFMRGGRALPSRWSRVARIAAAITLVVGTGIVGRTVWRNMPHADAAAPTFNVVSTARGQRLAIRLQDGTLVTLAPSTTLRTPSTYGVRDRTVELDGEAMFTVVHDASRPFAVRTARALARDLGTRFVVRAYGSDARTDVVVAEGEVAVVAARAASDRSPADSLVVRPGEQVQVHGDGRVALIKNVPLDRYFGWTDGRLVFRDTPLDEVVAQISRWYDVDVRLTAGAVRSLPVTVAFEHQSAGEAVRSVAMLVGLAVSQTGGTYTLTSR